ncbi:Uncharacterised protein [Vibrio cholerae]|uniref:Uncharacterized protein n=1 Tax=Vibrio cholerae TaxID=666 RepID=A0A655ZU78_VIBCL|nr:Uncharacterised protein [Vibrio cholerae]
MIASDCTPMLYNWRTRSGKWRIGCGRPTSAPNSIKLARPKVSLTASVRCPTELTHRITSFSTKQLLFYRLRRKTKWHRAICIAA